MENSSFYEHKNRFLMKILALDNKNSIFNENFQHLTKFRHFNENSNI